MSGPQRSDVSVERPVEGVALVTIRAERFNTLSAETLDALDRAVRGLVGDPDLAALVVWGAGGAAFAAGADIREVAELEPRTALGFATRGQCLFDRLERAPQLVFAAVDGYCMGGGLDLALACDIRYASPRSVFAHPGARLGILTGFGGTARLARTIGRAPAIELFATARQLSADEALSIGLVDRIEPDPVASALETAREITARGSRRASALKGTALRWWRRGLTRR